jgi:ring-1,2-phenylacetyl-CoA epoxidase subunit PaaC
MTSATAGSQPGSGASDVQRRVGGSRSRPSTVDPSVPADVSTEDLFRYCLMLGDDALILSHRLSEWGSRVPELEEDAALGAITLDLLGQARLLLSRAGEVEGAGRDENRLAYFRDASEFRNVRLVEIDCGPGEGGDFATTVARLLVFATWRRAVFARLAHTRDPVLSAVAGASVAELTRHRDHAAQWVIRLGDSTEQSRLRMVAGLQRVWPMAAELFAAHPVETRLADADCAVRPPSVRPDVVAELDEVLSVARLDLPDPATLESFSGPGGRDGKHTGTFEFLLAGMQYLRSEHLASG